MTETIMNPQPALPRLVFESVVLFALAVVIDVGHVVAMSLVPGYPRGNVAGALIWWIAPMVLVLIPIRTYMLMRNGWWTVGAALLTGLTAPLAVYLVLVVGYLLVGSMKVGQA